MLHVHRIQKQNRVTACSTEHLINSQFSSRPTFFDKIAWTTCVIFIIGAAGRACNLVRYTRSDRFSATFFWALGFFDHDFPAPFWAFGYFGTDFPGLSQTDFASTTALSVVTSSPATTMHTPFTDNSRLDTANTKSLIKCADWNSEEKKMLKTRKVRTKERNTLVRVQTIFRTSAPSLQSNWPLPRHCLQRNRTRCSALSALAWQVVTWRTARTAQKVSRARQYPLSRRHLSWTRCASEACSVAA